MARRTISIICALAPIFVLGCQAPSQPSGPTEMTVRIVDKDRFLDDAMTVLREHDFAPRQLDRETGLVVAGPSTSGQWFELWRADTRGKYNFLEANLHTVRNTVTLKLDPASPTASSAPASTEPSTSGPSPELFRFIVQVDKERLSAFERQVTTTGAALTMFSERAPTEEGYRDKLATTRQWVPKGRNELLETYLMRRIVEATKAEQVISSSDEADVSAEAGPSAN